MNKTLNKNINFVGSGWNADTPTLKKRFALTECFIKYSLFFLLEEV